MYGQSNQDSPETNCLEIKKKQTKTIELSRFVAAAKKKVFGGITYPCKNGT